MVMIVKPVGMLWMVPEGWLNPRAGAAGRAPEALLEGHLADRTHIFTLLADPAGGGGGPAEGGTARPAEGSTS